MKAVGLTSFGGAEVLRTLTLPTPEAGPGEVRIRIHAVAVSAPDAALREGWFVAPGTEPEFPYVPGMEMAGVIDQVGPGATGQVGDRVMAFEAPRPGVPGGYAEYLVVPANQVVAAPDGFDLASAATLPMSALAARMTLDLLDLQTGQSLVVTGAGGVVGGYVVQLAKVDGLHVIADAWPGNEERVNALGADAVVPSGDLLAQAVRELMPEGVDGLADCAAQNALAVPAIRDGGVMGTLRYWNGDPASPSGRNPFDYQPVSPGRGITLQATLVSNYLGNREKLDNIRHLAETGALTPPTVQILSLDQAREAHELLESRRATGRLVLATQ